MEGIGRMSKTLVAAVMTAAFLDSGAGLSIRCRKSER
jgi:hypothetical protein